MSFESKALSDLKAGLDSLPPRNRKRACAVGCMATLSQISDLRHCLDKKRHSRFRRMLLVAYFAAEVRFWRGYSADYAAALSRPVQADLFGELL